MSEKPEFYWVVDSAGTSSIHINLPNLTFAESFVGSLSHNKDADHNKQWTALDKNGDKLGTGSLHYARGLAEDHVRKTNPRVITYSPAPRKR